jgi:hypothetical protein
MTLNEPAVNMSGLAQLTPKFPPASSSDIIAGS